MRAAVVVQEPAAGGLHAPGADAGEPPHQLVSQPWVLLAGLAQPGSVQADGRHGADRTAVELPAVRLEQPGEPGDLAAPDCLNGDRLAARKGGFQ